MNKRDLNLQAWTLPSFGLVLLTFLISMGQLQRLELPQVALYAYDLLLGAWVVGVYLSQPQIILKVADTFKKMVKKNPVILGLLAVIGWGWFLAGVQGQFELRTWLYIIRFGVYALWGWSLYTLLATKQLPRLLSSLWLVWSAGMLIAWFGLWQYLFLPDTRFLVILGWDDHLGRLISTPLDPGFTGLLLVVTFLMSWKLPMARIIKVALSVGLVLLLALTYSRASYLAFGVGWLSFWWHQKNVTVLTRRQVTAGVLLFGILISVLVALRPYGGEGTLLLRTSTIAARIENMTQELHSLTLPEWLWGRGLFVFRDTPNPSLVQTQTGLHIPDHSTFPDNSIVWILSQLGILGLGLVLAVVWQLYQTWKSHPLLIGIFSAALVHSLFTATFTYSLFVIMWIWIVATETANAQKKN